MSASAPVRTNGHRRRAAGFYLMVLSVSMILMIIGLSALLAVRIQRRGAEGGNDLGAASLYAQSAIDLGMHWIENSPTWRTSRGEGFWAVNQPIGQGTFSLEANDLGSNSLLESSADTDAVLLTGTGFKGDARYKLQVTLVPDGDAPLTCLEVAMHAGTQSVGTDLVFDSALVNCNQTISVNNSVTASLSDITANVEVVNSWSGGSFSPFPTTGVDPRTMPDPSTVFDHYLTGGTAINIADIPNAQGKKTIENVLISPASNPYPAPGGPTNPDGIYIVDCQGANLRVRESRIVGTLLIVNPGTFSVQGSVNWEAAVSNYPALLVSGSAELAYVNTALSESAAGTNFNPVTTPYAGAWNTDTLDSYPSLIKGLVYVSDGINSLNYVTVDGVLVVTNTATVTGNLDLTYQQTYLDNPPPGFGTTGSGVQVVAGSWRRLVD